MEKVKVIYIMGYGRSGSTLLDRMLGQIEGFFSTGELNNIWQQSQCGCGRSFEECDVWSSVIQRVKDNLSVFELNELYQNQPWRRKYFPLLISPWQPRAFRERLLRFKVVLSTLYIAIHDVTGAEVIVDSSKNPLYALILSTLPSIDLRIVHLVRDSRAVAYSWTRKKAKTPACEAYLPTFSPVRSALEWGMVNLSSYHVKRRVPSTHLRYEDLIKEPRMSLERILRDTGLGSEPLEFLKNDEVHLRQDHSVEGNPMRFKQGVLRLHLDEEWKQNMEPSARRLITFLTAPLLHYYGFPLQNQR